MTMPTRRNRYMELLTWGEKLAGDRAGLELICLPPAISSGRAPDFMAYVEWSLFEITQDRRHADAARRLVAGPRKHWMAGATYHRQAALLDEFCHYPFAAAYVGLRDAGMLSAEENKTALAFFEGSLRFWQEFPSFFCGSTELNAGNLGISPACGADYAGRHIFKGVFGRSLRAWADRVWNGYWAMGDCLEDTTNYEPLHFVYMPLWASVRGQMKAVQNYVINGSYARALQQILPLGAPVDQGDAQWMSGWDGWLASFEIAAKITRDGRYAWAAQRILDNLLSTRYRECVEDGVRRAKAGEARYAFTVGGLPQSLFNFVAAVQWTDDTVAAYEPEGYASAITYRTYMSLPNAWEDAPLGGGSAGMTLFPQERGERHEDKLVLRSGYTPDANCLIASLDQKAWHDHDDSGAILAWVDKGQVLLHDAHATQRRLNAHNVLYVRPRTANVEEELGTTYFARGASYAKNRCVMDFIEDLSAASFARYKSVYLGGLDATWRRTLIFPRDGVFLAVLDEIASRSDDVWAAPLWHVQNVHTQGPDWADTDQGELWTFPNITWRCNTRRVLISAPLSGSLRRIRQKNPDVMEPRGPYSQEDRVRSWGQECFYQLGNVDHGAGHWFLTLLVPHALEVAAADLAARVRVLAQEPSPEMPPGSPPSWCVEITDETGARHLVGMAAPRLPVFYNVPRVDHLGYKPSWAGEQQAGDPHADRSKWFEVKDHGQTVLTTDAEIFYVRQAGDRMDIAVRRMRNLELGGVRHHAGISPCWPPTRFQVNGEFTVERGQGRAFYSCRNFNPIDLSFGFKPAEVKVTGGVNGIASTAQAEGETIRVGLNGTGEILARA